MKRILIVEDDLTIIEILKIIFKEKFEILVATDGKTAVKVYELYRPDLVLMDISLPVMDGIDATKEIMKIDPNARIIGVSAYAGTKGKELLKAGAKEVIEKPFTKKKLLETIGKYLNNSI